jgi:2-polyprenyl-6-methoxyphenol hydroxylase-like FAD-dependent oxidoreductase
VGQDRVQRILGEHLKKYGCEVEFSTELKSFEQLNDGVVAHLTKTEGGTEINEDLRVPYLVGADGARSALIVTTIFYHR